MMDVSSIQRALPFNPATITPGAGVAGAAAPATSTAGDAVGGFGQALVEAIGKLDQVQKESDSQSLQLAAGMPVELHDVMIAQDRAALSLDLAVQVRNRLLDSYHEVMRMQI